MFCFQTYLNTAKTMRREVPHFQAINWIKKVPMKLLTIGKKTDLKSQDPRKSVILTFCKIVTALWKVNKEDQRPASWYGFALIDGLQILFWEISNGLTVWECGHVWVARSWEQSVIYVKFVLIFISADKWMRGQCESSCQGFHVMGYP